MYLKDLDLQGIWKEEEEADSKGCCSHYQPSSTNYGVEAAVWAHTSLDRDREDGVLPRVDEPVLGSS
jgi:hypothetical protein